MCGHICVVTNIYIYIYIDVCSSPQPYWPLPPQAGCAPPGLLFKLQGHRLDSSSTCVLAAFQNELKGPPNGTQSVLDGTQSAPNGRQKGDLKDTCWTPLQPVSFRPSKMSSKAGQMTPKVYQMAPIVAVWLPPVELLVSWMLTGGTESHFCDPFVHVSSFAVRCLSITWLEMKLTLAQNVLTISVGILWGGPFKTYYPC